ncbi:MAG: Uma2 family endonuclease [Acidobacteriota bacterium]|nr:Uma2 family endonuclease [Acidobacteriota bacterium]
MAQVLSPIEQRVILHNISWETYQRLLTEHGESTGTRLIYDRGALEIMIVSLKHERLNRLLADLFTFIADELQIDFVGAGSTTFRREDLERGFEPDSCFYIKHADRIRDKDEVDLSTNPPPDLIIEIDITSPSLPRFPIFAAVGVPEIWRYDGVQVAIHQLVSGNYVAMDDSTALPGVTGELLTRFMQASETQKRTAWLRQVRAWARDQV